MRKKILFSTLTNPHLVTKDKINWIIELFSNMTSLLDVTKYEIHFDIGLWNSVSPDDLLNQLHNSTKEFNNYNSHFLSEELIKQSAEDLYANYNSDNYDEIINSCYEFSNDLVHNFDNITFTLYDDTCSYGAINHFSVISKQLKFSKDNNFDLFVWNSVNWKITDCDEYRDFIEDTINGDVCWNIPHKILHKEDNTHVKVKHINLHSFSIKPVEFWNWYETKFKANWTNDLDESHKENYDDDDILISGPITHLLEGKLINVITHGYHINVKKLISEYDNIRVPYYIPNKRTVKEWEPVVELFMYYIMEYIMNSDNEKIERLGFKFPKQLFTYYNTNLYGDIMAYEFLHEMHNLHFNALLRYYKHNNIIVDTKASAEFFKLNNEYYKVSPIIEYGTHSEYQNSELGKYHEKLQTHPMDEWNVIMNALSEYAEPFFKNIADRLSPLSEEERQKLRFNRKNANIL